MITIRRTWLVAPILEVEEEIWDYLQDDSGQEFDDWHASINDDSRWYVSSQGRELAATFLCRRLNHVTWEAHAHVRPKYWGNGVGTEHCQAAIDFMFEDTGAQKIVAIVATCFPETLKMTEAIGFRREGTRIASFQRDGKLYDEVYFGINRKPDE